MVCANPQCFVVSSKAAHDSIDRRGELSGSRHSDSTVRQGKALVLATGQLRESGRSLGVPKSTLYD